MKNLLSKIKDKIAKERYTTSFRLKVLIIVCWVAYITCLIIKLCGGNRFEIAITNQRRSGCVIESGTNNALLKKPGYYKIYGTITFTAPAAGLVTIQAQKNNINVPGLLTSGTVTTATTEVNTLPITGYIRVFL